MSANTKEENDGVREVPMEDIRRPLMPTLDEKKVKEIMASIEQEGQKVPVDAFETPDGNIWSFAGCHRYEATKRLGKPTLLCKVYKTTHSRIRMYLGSSYTLQDQ